MAISVYDKKHLSAADIAALKKYTKVWENANRAGDKKGMAFAHSAAESIRNKSNYSGGAWGNEYNQLSNNVESTPTVTNNARSIQSSYDSMARARQAELEGARSQAVSNYTSQMQGLPGQFRPLKDQVDVNTVRNIQRQNETAAAKGTAFTGGVASDQGATYAQGDQQKTALSAEEINLVNSLKKAITDTNRSSSLQQISAAADIQSQATRAGIDENNRVESFNYQRNQDNFRNSITEAGLTGQYQGKNTLAKDQINYAKERDKVMDGRWLQSFKQSAKDAASSRAISWGNLNLNREKYDWSKSPDNPNNVMTAITDSSESFQDAFKSAYDMLGATKKGVGSDGFTPIDVQQYGPGDVFNLIDNNPALTEKEKESLAKMLNLE